MNRELARFAFMIESGDARPAILLETSVEQSCQNVGKRLGQWRDLNQEKISPVNTVLQKYNMAALPMVTNIPTAPPCGKLLSPKSPISLDRMSSAQLNVIGPAQKALWRTYSDSLGHDRW